MLLEDDRFAFLMYKEHDDLQSLINHNLLKIGPDDGPFAKKTVE